MAFVAKKMFLTKKGVGKHVERLSSFEARFGAHAGIAGLLNIRPRLLDLPRRCKINFSGSEGLQAPIKPARSRSLSSGENSTKEAAFASLRTGELASQLHERD